MKKRSQQSLQTQHYFHKQLLKLKKKCENNGWNVLIKRRLEAEVDFKQRLITINSSNLAETQLYRLLHEIGHIILSEEKDYFEKFNEDYDSIKNLKLLRNRIKMLVEEVNAWDRGYAFAKQEKIKLNIKNFEDCKAFCLKCYINWIINNG